MAKRGGKRGDGDNVRPSKLPAADPARDAAEDQLFRDAMERLERVPVKDTLLDLQANQEKRPSRPKDEVVKIDLHRLTLAEAEGRVDTVLRGLIAGLATGASVKVQIITGKGRHSSGGGVLARDIHLYVSRRFASHIVSLEDSPADLVVGELPIRGHFHVTLGTKFR